jgi:hypothetical protein
MAERWIRIDSLTLSLLLAETELAAHGDGAHQDCLRCAAVDAGHRALAGDAGPTEHTDAA